MKQLAQLFSLLFILLSGSALSQYRILSDPSQVQQKTFWASIELGRAFGLATKGGGYTQTSSKGFVMNSYLLRGKLGYYLTPKLSLGAGIGLTGHHNPTINTMPLVLDFRYHFIASVPQFFAYMEAGKSIAPNNSFTSGGVGNLGLAYRLKVGKRTYLNPSLGYDLFTHRISVVYPEDPTSNQAWNEARHSIFIKIGVEF